MQRLRRFALACACGNALATVAFKWLMAVLVRKLLWTTRDEDDDDNLVVESRDSFWSAVFLDELSFGAIAALASLTALIMVLCSSTFSGIAVVLAHRRSQQLRKTLLKAATSCHRPEKKEVDALQDKSTMAETVCTMDSAFDDESHRNLLPDVLIRQIATIERFYADHEMWLLSERLIVLLCILLVFVFHWLAGTIAVLLLGLSEFCASAFGRFRQGVLLAVQQNLAITNAHLLDVLKNRSYVVVAQTQKAELTRLQQKDQQSDRAMLLNARFKMVGDMTRIGIVSLVPVAIAVSTWPKVNDLSGGDAANVAFSVIAALLLLDEAHKSMVHLVFIEDRAKEARQAEKIVEASISNDDSSSAEDHNNKKATNACCTSEPLNGLSLVPATPTDGPFKAPDSDTVEQNIVVENVTLTYAGRSKAAVGGLSLTLDCGRNHGIVGDSGSGKSSLLKMMAGLVHPNLGSIDLGCHEKIAFMSQASESALFARSIRENVTYGDTGSDDESTDSEIWRALQLAEIDGWVLNTNDQLDTILTEGEHELSGGEHQRLHLARVFYTARNADLVLMDECVSELDPLRRTRVISNLQQFLAHKTAVIVTHHSEILAICDEVHDLSSTLTEDDSTLFVASV